MSHIVEIQTQVKDVTAARSACSRLGLEPPTEGAANLFGGSATGVIVQLPGWQYPVVFDTRTGDAHFDNYGGRWGEQQQLDRFLQASAVEKAMLEARRNGHSVTERQLDDGSIKLTVNRGTERRPGGSDRGGISRATAELSRRAVPVGRPGRDLRVSRWIKAAAEGHRKPIAELIAVSPLYNRFFEIL